MPWNEPVVAISRQIFQQFLLDKPASPRSLSPQEEAELASEGLLEIANQKLLRREAHLQGAARELGWRALLQELDKALAAQRSQAIVFKGGAALGRLYQTGQRPLSDLDLLGDEHLPAVLRSLNFAPVSENSWIWGRGRYLLDTHQHPLGRLQHAFGWNLRRAWQQSEPLSQRRGLFRFTTEDEMVVALVHAGKHAYSRLIWLADIHLLLERCQPQRLKARLLESGAGSFLRYSHWLLAHLSDRPEAAPRLNRLDRALLELCLQRKTSESLGMLLPLLVTAWPCPALPYLWRCLRPQEDEGWRGRAAKLRTLAKAFLRHADVVRG